MKNSEGINMYKKNLVMFATVVMMAAFVSACGNGKQEIKETAVIETMKDSQEASENVQIANPWIEVKTMEEAKNMAGFDLKLPEIPAEYGKKMIQVLDSADALTIEVMRIRKYESGKHREPGISAEITLLMRRNRKFRRKIVN